MPAQPARFLAPAAVDPWGSAGGQAAWSSSVPRASMVVRWDQKPEDNPNTQKRGEEEREAGEKHSMDKHSVYGNKHFKEKKILHHNQAEESSDQHYHCIKQHNLLNHFNETAALAL